MFFIETSKIKNIYVQLYSGKTRCYSKKTTNFYEI